MRSKQHKNVTYITIDASIYYILVQARIVNLKVTKQVHKVLSA